MQDNRARPLTRSTIAATLAAGAIAIGGAGTAAAASVGDAASFAELDVSLSHSHLERTLEAIELRDRYRDAYREAKKLGVAPRHDAARRRSQPDALRRKLTGLRKAIHKAKAERRAKAERKAKFASPESVGVSSATLESIAACESGGNPGAVSASGSYRGKYQFDYGTWARVGGSGDPAAASEQEQDYRAALLYARSGSSPWPVCGA